MSPEERDLITGLFDRMRSYGRPEKDMQAETLIVQSMRQNPDAGYRMVPGEKAGSPAGRLSRIQLAQSEAAGSAEQDPQTQGPIPVVAIRSCQKCRCLDDLCRHVR